MNMPGYQAESSLSANRVSAQMSLGNIFGTVWCYGGCLWRYFSCISRCGSDFECALCQVHLATCPLICTPIVLE